MHPMKMSLTLALLAAATLSAGQLTVGTSNNQLSMTLSGAESKVGVKLFDLMGRELFNQQEMALTSGMHALPLNSSLARGMYIMQVSVDGKQFSKKMIAGSSATFSVGNANVSFATVYKNVEINSVPPLTSEPIITSITSHIGATAMENIGDINGDGNEDLILKSGVGRNSKLEIVKMGSNGQPLGGYNTISIHDQMTPGEHMPFFLQNVIKPNSDLYYTVPKAFSKIGKASNGMTMVATLFEIYETNIGQTWNSFVDDLQPIIMFIDNAGNVKNYHDLSAFVPVPVGAKPWGIASIGDVDGNGVDDLCVTYHYRTGSNTKKHPNSDKNPPNSFTTEGFSRVYLIEKTGDVKSWMDFDASTGMVESIIGATSQQLYLKADVCKIGDIDGDKITDILVGTTVMFLNRDGSFKSKLMSIQSLLESKFLPNTYSVLGDLNGDGQYEVTGFPQTGINNITRQIYTIVPGAVPSLSLLTTLNVENGTFPEEIRQYPDKTRFFKNNNSITRTDKGNSALIRSETGDLYLYANDRRYIGDTHSANLWSIRLDDFWRDPRTEEQKMLSFSGSQYWSTLYSDVSTRSYVAGYPAYDQDMDITMSRGCYQRLKSTIPYTGLIGSTPPRVRMEIELMVPEDPAHPGLLPYRGNFQLMINNRWAAQFDINSVVGIGNAQLIDGWYYLHYSMLLSDDDVNVLKTTPANLEVTISSVKQGERFVFKSIRFLPEDVTEGNRVVSRYIDNFEIGNVPFYSSTSTLGGAVPLKGGPDMQGTVQAVRVSSIVQGKTNDYYIIRQDVDYPMYLVEEWASNYGYQPGNPYGPWRQCWMFVGSL